MAPRKKSRARPVPARTKTGPEPSGRHVLAIGGLEDIPAPIRERMLVDLLALQNGAQRVVPPPSDMRVSGAMVASETRGQALIGRMTQLVADLDGTIGMIENSVRNIGGAWPWPEPPAAGKTALDAEPDNFHGVLEARLDRLQGIVRHAGIVAERLRDIA